MVLQSGYKQSRRIFKNIDDAHDKKRNMWATITSQFITECDPKNTNKGKFKLNWV
jgi:hypothetical protein